MGNGSGDSHGRGVQEMRTAGREVYYLVGTPRGKIQQYEKRWLELPWQKVRESVEVKLFAEDGETYVLAKSEGRHAKERAMRRRKLVRLLKTLAQAAPQCSGARSTAAADRRGQEGSRPRLRLRASALSPRGGASHPARRFTFHWTKRNCGRQSCAMATICCARTCWAKSRKCSGNSTSSSPKSKRPSKP